MIFRYSIVSFTLTLLVLLGVVEASVQKAPVAKPFERVFRGRDERLPSRWFSRSNPPVTRRLQLSRKPVSSVALATKLGRNTSKAGCRRRSQLACNQRLMPMSFTHSSSIVNVSPEAKPEDHCGWTWSVVEKLTKKESLRVLLFGDALAQRRF